MIVETSNGGPSEVSTIMEPSPQKSHAPGTSLRLRAEPEQYRWDVVAVR
jgi:hypothetical protein